MELSAPLWRFLFAFCFHSHAFFGEAKLCSSELDPPFSFTVAVNISFKLSHTLTHSHTQNPCLTNPPPHPHKPLTHIHTLTSPPPPPPHPPTPPPHRLLTHTTSDGTGHFSNRCNICKVAKMVHGSVISYLAFSSANTHTIYIYCVCIGTGESKVRYNCAYIYTHTHIQSNRLKSRMLMLNYQSLLFPNQSCSL